MGIQRVLRIMATRSDTRFVWLLSANGLICNTRYANFLLCTVLLAESFLTTVFQYTVKRLIGHQLITTTRTGHHSA
jgi:hypothetical protein